MAELDLIGLHEDGEHLILRAADGQHYLLPIDDPLRAAVRRDRPQLEQIRREQSGVPSPREIQSRVRAGQTAEQIAEDSGLTVDQVRRFEGPVVDERAYLAEQARGTRVGRDPGAPELGDLVVNRLAARGVEAASIVWDARRAPGTDWSVLVRFDVEGDEREARWSYDPATRSLHAEEDEARWLSETEIDDGPLRRRHLAAVRDVAYEVDAEASVRPVLAAVDASSGSSTDNEEPKDATEVLLDDLRARRGVRQSVDFDDDGGDDEEFSGFGPQHAFDFGVLDRAHASRDSEHPERVGHPSLGDIPGAHPADADPTAEAKVYPIPRVVEPAHTPPEPEPPAPLPEDDKNRDDPPPRKSRGRAKVPSWDEIVFGAKPE